MPIVRKKIRAMIEKLESYQIRDQYGDVYGEQPPSVWEMMRKINELVEAVNRMEKQIEKQKEQKHPNGCFTCDEYKKGYEEGRRNGFTAGYNKAIKEVEQNVDDHASRSHEVELLEAAVSGK